MLNSVSERIEQLMQPAVFHAAKNLVRIALQEDLQDSFDLTTDLLIPQDDQGQVTITSRQSGILCGTPIISMVLEEIDSTVDAEIFLQDGDRLNNGSLIAELSGNVRALLTAERTILNFMTLLSGVSSLTQKYVQAANNPAVKILDTRKTLPGLRLLQKYAVECGGGTNHRFGLFDAVLVKDNHLADWLTNHGRSLADAVRHLKRSVPAGVPVQFEVDDLGQLAEILPELPDMILLDNMSTDQLRAAVQLRNELAPTVLLEASGGVSLTTIAGIALTGVDRISVGALTHSAPALDLGFDWS